ncbi:hypothetical protein ELQ35_10500 [Peribacillus cavernae]|uniref:Sulfotransferase family protein n=1 Tax=Peribacillus cavernae TaxID=1674310 RepID=A0A433HM82_9BACI|nr:sulfotransferase family 2 domain-containing protein [Peribacillus cavernae]MDQ0218900.1 hypothetical protein [Peribacillus cavernae]RUQ29379.1 hypothetical protein ELQ35_10500 [Peribacillus cavernae]
MTEQTNNLFIHLHMPKTAGTTLNSIIKKNYKSNEIIDLYESFKDHQEVVEKLQSLQLSGVKCINCHLSYGIHCHVTQPAKYVTMLREPIERVASEYYFIRNTPHHNLHDKVMKMDLLEFQQEPTNMNKQSKIVLGIPLSEDVSKADFRMGKQNIKADFAFIGITELFNESIVIMKKQFDWPDIQYGKKNITTNRPQVTDLPEHVIEELKQYNKVDYALYKYAIKLLKVRLMLLDSESKILLQAMNMNNGIS